MEEPFSDDDLVERFRTTGERAAFAELWRRHGRTIYARCLRILGNTGAAEDVTSETFLVAMKEIRGYRKGNFGAWLSEIAKNRSINWLRSAAVRLREGGVEHVDIPAERSDPEFAAEMESILRQLHAEQRITLKLLYIDGYSYKEVAQLQGWSVKQVKTYAQSGKRNFRRIWERLRV